MQRERIYSHLKKEPKMMNVLPPERSSFQHIYLLPSFSLFFEKKFFPSTKRFLSFIFFFAPATHPLVLRKNPLFWTPKFEVILAPFSAPSGVRTAEDRTRNRSVFSKMVLFNHALDLPPQTMGAGGMKCEWRTVLELFDFKIPKE